MKNVILVSFFGSSGVGKSTCFELVEPYLKQHGYEVYKANVAKPLRLIQNYAQLVFGHEYQNPDSLNFKQDGQLLGFLAKHYESRLGIVFRETVESILDRSHDRRIAIINTDCRNNAYDTLKDLGFIFIKVDVSDEVLKNRRAARGDLTSFDHSSSVEQYDKIKYNDVIQNDGTLKELEETIRNKLEIIIQKTC